MRDSPSKNLSLRFQMPDGLLAVVSLAVWVVAFWDPLSDIFRQASSRVDQGYILLVPLVAAYLAFLRRSRWRMVVGGGNSVGIILVILGIVTSTYGLDRDHIVLWHVGPLISLLGILICLLGYRFVPVFFPAILAAFAVVPVPGFIRQQLSQPMQNMATNVTSSILDLFGVPVTRIGNVLQIQDQAVAVGEACNGMRLMLPLALVIYAFVFAIPLKGWTRLFLVLASVPVAILCNTLRLVPTAIAYGYLPSWATFVHDLGGWLMIPMAIWILLFLLRLAVWIDLPVGRWRLVGA